MKKVIISVIFLFALSLYFSSLESSVKNEIIQVIIYSRTEVTVVKAERVFDEKAIKGLSGWKELSADSGILFDMNEFYKEWNDEQRKKAKNSIWMLNMNFPIDIIWIDDGEIIHVVEGAPIPYKNHIPYYGVVGHCDYILEINKGFIAAHGIAVGDRIELKK